MQKNTAPRVTHKGTQSNFFHIPNAKIARSGLLEKIKFEQWHIFSDLRKKTRNINLINFASLLAVFPRMGIYAYEISQSVLAEKMAELFDMPLPARNTISAWENQLEKMGFLQIPKHVDWRASKTKIRVITKEFWNVSRKGLENLSYTCPHVTFCAGKVERVIQVIPKVINDPVKNTETEIRAREVKKQPKQLPRAVSQNLKFSRPPKNQGSIPKKLSRFENSIMFWLFQNNKLRSYREGVIIFGRFLQAGRKDQFYLTLEKAWNDCRDASRPGLVADLINNFRDDDTDQNGAQNFAAPLQLLTDDIAAASGFNEHGQIYVSPSRVEITPCNDSLLACADTRQIDSNTEQSDPEYRQVIQCMINGRQDCSEKQAPLIQRFKSAPKKEKQYILEHIESLVLIGGKQAVAWLDTLRNSAGF